MAVVEKESSSSHIQVNKASGASETKRSHGSPAASNEESDYD